jgi:hypothetical protein
MTLHRLKIIRALFLLLSVGIITRLFYWQVLASDSLAKLAQIQHSSRNELPAQRGQIYTSDNFPLVQNQDSFLVYAYLPDMRLSPEEIADKLANGLATDSAQFSTKLTRTDTTWVPLVKKLSPGQKESLAQLNLSGVGFDMEPIRLYPEASTAVHLLGFLGWKVFMIWSCAVAPVAWCRKETPPAGPSPWVTSAVFRLKTAAASNSTSIGPSSLRLKICSAGVSTATAPSPERLPSWIPAPALF